MERDFFLKKKSKNIENKIHHQNRQKKLFEKIFPLFPWEIFYFPYFSKKEH